jgi:nucleoside-diphosphate-sugar epimerase
MADTTMVTGGSGFIGSHLTKQLLERGDRVNRQDTGQEGLIFARSKQVHHPIGVVHLVS